MNKCKNCGTEFEGNFCPKCGTASDAPKVCPKCNAQLYEGARYCSKCGYDLLGESSVYATKRAPIAHTASIVTGSVVQNLLKYLPTALFALWAVLLWAFYAAPVMKGDGFLLENVNLYQLVKDEMFVDLYPVCYALIAFAAISCAYAFVLVLLQFRGSDKVRKGLFVSFAFYVAVIVCAAVLGAKYNESVGELEDTNGSLVAVVIVLSAVFAVLQVVLLVLSRKYIATKSSLIAHTTSIVTGSVVQNLLKYLPTALFALWAVLLWAFYAAPVMKGDGFLLENVNLYQLVKDEMFVDLYPVCYALIAFAAISCAYAFVLVLLQFRGSDKVRKGLFVSFAFYVAVIVCAAVLGAKYNESVGELEDTNGSMVAVVISLSAVFALLNFVVAIINAASKEVKEKLFDAIDNWFILMR